MNLKISIFMLLLAIPLSIIGQSIEQDSRIKDAQNLIETWIEAQAAYDQIPGITMAIVYDQKVIWRYATGYLDLEKKTPATTSTIYSICSISKLFTSIALSFASLPSA